LRMSMVDSCDASGPTNPLRPEDRTE
jgi:hypothetical protein